MDADDKLRWLFRFRKTDLQKLSSAERRVLAHDLRALARTIGVGWSWRHRPRPLSERELRTVHAQVSHGLRALDEAVKRPRPLLQLGDGLEALTKPSVAGLAEQTGWRLPAHRTWLRPLPRQTDDPKERAVIATIYEARDEPSAIVAAVGHFFVHEWRRWRICPCGCGARYVPVGKQIYYENACENRARGRRRRKKKRVERASRPKRTKPPSPTSSDADYVGGIAWRDARR